ncbi:MAG: endonuclease III [Sulfolobales archaeon]
MKTPTSSIADRVSGSEILRILSENLMIDWKQYTALVAKRFSDGSLFPILVGVILSQNTNDRNSIKAYMLLRERIGVKIEDILRASLEEIEELIKPAGLWKQKAEAIKRSAEVIRDLGGEEFLAREDPEKIRMKLLEIKGVGKKTVDVFLSVARRAPYFAVDTHAMRIALRWGLVKRRNYDEASKALREYFGSDNAEKAHQLLIALGRRYCRARKPLCSECFLKSICPSSPYSYK